jgi:hypothetical protein
MLLMMAFSVLSVVTCMVMKTNLRRANKKLLKQEGDTGIKVSLYPL